MHTRNISNKKGFTLIELLIVIGIIGFLAAAVLVAVDPVKRIQDSRDAKRYSEVNGILNAMLTKQVDVRSTFEGLASAPVVTSATLSQVIVTSDAGVACGVPATAPACPGATLSVLAGKACVANLGGQMAGTATSAAAVLTGAGTAFNTEAVVGDTLLSASGGECVILGTPAPTATAVTCALAPTPVFAGAVFNKSQSIVPLYLGSIPVEPRGAGALPTPANLALGSTNSGYYIHRTNGNRIEIGSCYPEQATTVSVKR